MWVKESVVSPRFVDGDNKPLKIEQSTYLQHTVSWQRFLQLKGANDALPPELERIHNAEPLNLANEAAHEPHSWLAWVLPCCPPLRALLSSIRSSYASQGTVNRPRHRFSFSCTGSPLSYSKGEGFQRTGYEESNSSPPAQITPEMQYFTENSSLPGPESLAGTDITSCIAEPRAGGIS